MNFYGFGHQYDFGYRIADDFTISDPHGWQVDTITFYAYQTGSATSPSSITGVYLQIWDGPPDNPSSNVVFGDFIINRLVSSVWSGIYRGIDWIPSNTNRPIMSNTVNVGVTLGPGTYWLDWMTDGSLFSGPWAPTITINNETTTGNALQYISSWIALYDVGPQGFPFIIEGNVNISYYRLRVVKSGLGHGTVNSKPKGIDCGNDCRHNYEENTKVTLYALADEGSEFGGWTGNVRTGHENDNPLIIKMNSNKTITAIFNDTPPIVYITNPENGSIVYGVTNVKGVAEDAYGVTKVELYINEVKKGEFSTEVGGIDPGSSENQYIIYGIKTNYDRKVDSHEREIVLKSNSQFEKIIIQNFPEYELIKPKLINSVTKMKRFYDYLLIAGKDEFENRLILYDLSTKEEISLLNENIEIKHLECLRDGKILFDGLALQNRKFVVGIYEPEGMESITDYHYKELASVEENLLNFKALEIESSLFAAFSKINKETTESEIYLTAKKYVSTLLKSSDKKVDFDFDLDSMEYPNGTCKIKVVATDTVGQQASDEITVTVQNIVLTIQASMNEDHAWIIKKLYGKIDLSIENLGSVPISKYIIYRSESGEEFQNIGEISELELQNGRSTYVDKYLEKNENYTYKVEALDSNGVIMGRSNEVTIHR